MYHPVPYDHRLRPIGGVVVVSVPVPESLSPVVVDSAFESPTESWLSMVGVVESESLVVVLSAESLAACVSFPLLSDFDMQAQKRKKITWHLVATLA